MADRQILNRLKRGTAPGFLIDIRAGKLPPSGLIGNVRRIEPEAPDKTAEAMKGYYELKTAGADEFHFTLHSANHETVLVSQLYASKADALTGIHSVRENGPHDSRFARKLSALGEPYFLLKAANGQVIGTSEMYGSEASRDNGVRAVMACSTTATVKDLAGGPE